MRDNLLNQLKLKVNDTYKKDEKVTTNYEPSNDEDVINKAYLAQKVCLEGGHIRKIEKTSDEINLISNKQSVEEVQIQRAVNTTVQILYDKGLLDIYDNADELLKAFLFAKKWRPDLEEVHDVIIQ